MTHLEAWVAWLEANPDSKWKRGIHDARIVPWCTDTEAVYLSCLNHPDLRWHTQNLYHIGYKRITFAGNYDDVRAKSLLPEMMDRLNYKKQAKECSCPFGDLVVVVPEIVQLGITVNIANEDTNAPAWVARRLALRNECHYCFQEEAANTDHHSPICSKCVTKYASWNIHIMSDLSVESFLMSKEVQS